MISPFISQMTPEQKVAHNVMNVILPAFQEFLPKLDAQGTSWSANKILEKIQEEMAAKNGDIDAAIIGGYSARDWIDLNSIFSLLKAFLDEEVIINYPNGSTKNSTPREVVMKFYKAK